MIVITDHSTWAKKQVDYWEQQFDARLREFMFSTKDNFQVEALKEFASSAAK